MLFPSPQWFYSYDVILEILFAVITAFVSFFAISIYRKSSQKYVLYFGLGFAFISLSYLLQSVINFMILLRLGEREALILKIIAVQTLNNYCLLAHVLFFTLGLIFLLFITFKETRTRLLWLLIISSLSVIFMSANTLYMFYLLASIYLFFITWHHVWNYIRHRKKQQLLVALAFMFLFFGQFHFLISVNHDLFYVAGHVLELIAYIFVVWNFFLVRKR